MSETAIEFFSDIAEDFAAAYAKDPDFRDRYELWTRILNQYATGKKSAIDMGCGAGIFSFYLGKMGLTVKGIDAAKGMIRLCESHKEKHGITNCSFICAKIPGAELALPKSDLIISSSVLEYIDDLEPIFRSFHELLNDHGYLIISLPNKKSIYRQLEKLRFRLSGKPEYYRHVRQLMSAEECVRKLARNGFVCEQLAYYGHANSVSKIARQFLPLPFSENLFVGVFRRS